jgi:WD40 repeat protein
MPDPTPARVFVSYSRKDGAAFAAELRETLLKQDLSIWQDIVALEGGRDWWSQIEDTIRSKALQHFVLVVTRAALASPVVRREIRLARQEGKTVSLVKGPGLGDLGKVPRWFGNVYELDRPESLRAFIDRLRRDSQQKRVPMMAPEPPVDFVRRPAEFEALKAKLLDAKGDAVAISAALKGAGGYGKTTLAKALAHDPDIQDAYFDGILWVELGEKPDDLMSRIVDFIETLTGTRPGFQTIDAGAAALGDALGDRRILMIVDDVWREQDLRPFLRGGGNTTRLITTRLNRVLPVDAFRQAVDAMKGAEARELLSGSLPKEEVRAQYDALSGLAGRLGEWAQLLKLVNGFLRERVIEGGERLWDAIGDANERLNEEGFVAFDAEDESDRTRAVARTINLSLGLLDEKQRARFAELAVFPEDADIPIGIVARLWRGSAGLSEGQTKDLLIKLYGLSLLLGLDLNQRTFRFHDTIRRFLQDQAGKAGLAATHKQLLLALDDIGTSPETDALSRRYYYLYLPHHLAEAQERDKLDKLLLDPGWLKAKLSATSSPHALAADYQQYGVGELQNFIGRTLRLTTGILARDPRQLMPQLLGRIMGCKAVGAGEFLEAARRQLSPPAILAERLSLTPPGAETARLEGHSDLVSALCMLPDGRLASSSHDNTIRLWDVTAGAETSRLEEHPNGVGPLCMLPDGRVALGSEDNTIRLWDVTAGAETARLEGHSHWVQALCVLPDGRLASGSDDNTIRLWDVTAGAETARLGGHSGWVTALCMLLDGRLASGSEDNTILLWDVTAGTETARLEGHSRLVTALCMLPDGRLASGSGDNTIRCWNVADGADTARLDRHSRPITALCILPDGRLAPGAWDNTIRLWDVTAAETARLEGHSGPVAALCALPDGHLASGSWDNTIRVWDVTAGAEIARLEGHSDLVAALCALPDGRLVSRSSDNTIRLWDVTAGAEAARLKEHPGSVRALCALPDGRLASGSWDSWDNTIRLWDVKAGAETARLEGHSALVAALCVLPDGRLASGSYDNTIRLWEVTAGAETARLEGHSGSVEALCVLPDGRLASGSEDNTIRLWDVTTGAETETARLEVDAPITCVVALAPGRLVAGDAIGRLHWLEIVD